MLQVDTLTIRFKRLSPHAVIPRYQTEHAAGMDLHAAVAAPVAIPAGAIRMIPCGFAMAVPVHLKLGNLGEVVRINENEPGLKTTKYYDRTRDGKLLLREAMERHIPAEVTNREKQGFSAPDASWFKGESIDYVRRMLLDRNARIYSFLDYAAVTALIEEHLKGTTNRRLLIWSLLNVESWCAAFAS